MTQSRHLHWYQRNISSTLLENTKISPTARIGIYAEINQPSTLNRKACVYAELFKSKLILFYLWRFSFYCALLQIFRVV